MGFPENLARLQAERGETNYRLAMAVGVHQTSIKNWKCGTSKPQYRHLSAIAEHFGISVADLLKEKQETAHAASCLSEVERGKANK